VLALAVLAAVATPAAAASRKEANKTALEVLKPKGKRSPLTVFALRKPVKAGSVVVEGGPGVSVRHGRPAGAKPLKRRAFLYWMDLAPGALFQHPSVLLLVDAKSGKPIRRTRMSFWPTVNGKRLKYARKPLYSTAGPVRKKKKAAAFLAVAPYAWAAALPNLAKDCMVTIGDRKDPIFKGDFELMQQVASAVGLKRYDATTIKSLKKKIAEAKAAGCKDVFIMIAAHGWAANGSGINVAQSAHAQVTIKAEVKTKKGGTKVVSEDLNAEHLRDIFKQFGDLTFKLGVSACFSGRWLELGDVSNLRFIGAGARADQMGWGAFQTHGTYKMGDQVNGVLTQNDHTLKDNTTNTTGATEYTNGFLRGLLYWAQTDKAHATTGDDLAKGLVYAAQIQGENNFSEQAGWANAQYRDMSANGVPAPGGGGPGGGAPGGAAPNAAPDAVFDFSPNSAPSHPKVGEAISFSSVGSGDPDGSIVDYSWNFGDTNSGSGASPSHAFTAPGKYTVRLTVTDNRGATDFVDHLVFVSGPGSKPASLNDIPCPDAGHPTTDVEVRIRIPSYAQNPAASITSAVSCAGSTTSMFAFHVEGGNDIHELDEWGVEKNTLVVTFRVSGGTTGVDGSATVTATWD
jgi:PKD repeat protein